ncbi:protein KHNYN [Discoglossus pictus]
MLMDLGENEVELDHSSLDEFAVPQGSEKELRDQKPQVERIFGVILNILGVLNQTQVSERAAGPQQIWLQLQGERRSIEKAKNYIKGLCTPDITEDLTYPRELHCIFVGAKGLFLDSLIRATSAYMRPLTPGRIRISGLIEEAVMAQSRIDAFLEKCNFYYKPDEHEGQIKRDFKCLVEEYSDIHVLDLLILPTSVKEQLLALVNENNHSGWTRDSLSKPMDQSRILDNQYDMTMHNQTLFPPSAQFHHPQKLEKYMNSKPVETSKSRPGRQILHHRASEPIQPMVDTKWDYNNRPRSLDTSGTDQIQDNTQYNQKEVPREEDIPCRDDDTEFQKISGLLDTIMGRDDGEPGSNHHFSMGTQKEFNMLLDFFKTMGYQESIVLKVLSENGIQEPSQILDKVKLEESSYSQNKPSNLPIQAQDLSPDSFGKDDDYILEVVKSAAKNCGYSPTEIVDIGDGSVAGLLRKLNKKTTSSEDHRAPSNDQRHIHQQPSWQLEQNSYIQPRIHISQTHIAQPDVEMSGLLRHKPMLQNHPVEDLFPGGIPQGGGETEEAKDLGKQDGQSGPVVTGAQRFNEAMQTPFQLNLKNERGNEQLRHIIIDGSNVAMIHGLHRFFSCRGIALAVQYFWDRGHRNITVFVPQWRMKKDAKVKEQHFLTELNELGLLSFTPSRVVEGKRITSYDDRFMLQLAEKTDGVIVTNDNLRDFSAESQAWKNIIKERLLQFTFVGDIFMVPDDPLGRNGPPLDQFLCRNSRPRTKSKGHSYAGRRVPHTPPKPSSQTEVLNLRDRKPGVRLQEEETDMRSQRETERLRQELLSIFPRQDTKVDFILQREPSLSDLNKLSELILTLKF